MVEITGDETIGDVVRDHPKAAGVMLKYGLHCVGCHVNQYESIKQGAMGHGMPKELVERMIKDLNEFLNRTIETVELSDLAQDMIRTYMLEDGKEGWGLRVKVIPGGESFGYDMEFCEEPSGEDHVFEFDDVKLFIDPESYKLLKGSEIDFVDTMHEAGFRIDNPNAPKAQP